MPGWHEATKKFQENNKVQVVGIIQEQHPDRARLFMQWHQMNWPIMVDALNLLEVSAVPITIFIDEFGIIQEVNPRLKNSMETLDKFLSDSNQQQMMTITVKKGQENLNSESKKQEPDRDSTQQPEANRLFLWAGPEQLDQTIALYRKALETDQKNGSLFFRLGVAYRKRYDSKYRNPSDFKLAIDHWQMALDIDPNQYIWRRRIQQYGPRLDKPYPFYDWIFEARDEIKKRGETPVDLVVEPGGAEYAKPIRNLDTVSSSQNEPDPQARITRDEEKLINVEYVVVKSTSKRQKSVRIHVEFSPNQDKKAHWNNEVDNLELWFDPPSGWIVESQKITFPNPDKAVSKEVRKIEFELIWPDTEQAKFTVLPAYALYYVCEDVNGACLYRRRDIPIKIYLNE